MCPHCSVDNSKVLETRRDGHAVYRRRRCIEPLCGLTFISRESSSLYMKFPEEIREPSLDRLLRAVGKRA